MQRMILRAAAVVSLVVVVNLSFRVYKTSAADCSWSCINADPNPCSDTNNITCSGKCNTACNLTAQNATGNSLIVYSQSGSAEKERLTKVGCNYVEPACKNLTATQSKCNATGDCPQGGADDTCTVCSGQTSPAAEEDSAICSIDNCLG